MKFLYKISIALSTFLVFPINVKADFSMIDSDSDPLFQNNSIDSIISAVLIIIILLILVYKTYFLKLQKVPIIL